MTSIIGRIPIDNNRKPVLAGVSSADGLTVTTVYVDPTTHALLTSATITPSGTQDINLKQVNGQAVNVGTGTAGTGTARVAVSSDSSIASITTGVTPGTGTANLGKAEDQGSVDSDVGVGALAVRKATPANTSGTDGDYEFLQMSAGRLWVSEGATSPTGAAIPSSAIMFGLSDGTNLVAAKQASNAFNATAGGAQVVALAAQFDDVSPTVPTENNFANVRISAARALHTEHNYSVTRVTADTQIKATAGFVHTITVSPTTATPTAGLVTVYDSAAESGTAIFSEWVFATDQAHTITLDGVCATGIYVGYDATLANVSVTVSWR